MISKDFVLRLHQLSIHLWGGSDGVRDISSLESAIIRPYQTFGGENLYNDVFGKAAAIIESIIINHPFVDGNKRTGLLAMLAVLNHEKQSVNVSNDDLYEFVIRVSTGEMKFEQIMFWLKTNTVKI